MPNKKRSPKTKKTPRIAAWCRSAFRFNVLYSSNFDGTSHIQGLPCGRFQPTASPRRIAPYHQARLTGQGIQEQVFDFAVYS